MSEPAHGSSYAQLQQQLDAANAEIERLRAELAASGNYIANAEVAPTFIAFANKRTVKIVDGALEVGWLDDRDEEIAGPVAWKYAVGIKGSLALDQVSKLKAELATARSETLEVVLAAIHALKREGGA